MNRQRHLLQTPSTSNLSRASEQLNGRAHLPDPIQIDSLHIQGTYFFLPIDEILMRSWCERANYFRAEVEYCWYRDKLDYHPLLEFKPDHLETAEARLVDARLLQHHSRLSQGTLSHSLSIYFHQFHNLHIRCYLSHHLEPRPLVRVCTDRLIRFIQNDEYDLSGIISCEFLHSFIHSLIHSSSTLFFPSFWFNLVYKMCLHYTTMRYFLDVLPYLLDHLIHHLSGFISLDQSHGLTVDEVSGIIWHMISRFKMVPFQTAVRILDWCARVDSVSVRYNHHIMHHVWFSSHSRIELLLVRFMLSSLINWFIGEFLAIYWSLPNLRQPFFSIATTEGYVVSLDHSCISRDVSNRGRWRDESMLRCEGLGSRYRFVSSPHHFFVYFLLTNILVRSRAQALPRVCVEARFGGIRSCD